MVSEKPRKAIRMASISNLLSQLDSREAKQPSKVTQLICRAEMG